MNRNKADAVQKMANETNEQVNDILESIHAVHGQPTVGLCASYITVEKMNSLLVWNSAKANADQEAIIKAHESLSEGALQMIWVGLELAGKQGAVRDSIIKICHDCIERDRKSILKAFSISQTD